MSEYTERLRAMGVAEDEYRLCLAPQLVAEHERLVDELARAVDDPDARLNSGGTKRRIAEQVRDVEARMAADTIVLKLRSLAGRFAALEGEHPPRKGEDGTVDERDRRFGPGVNMATFPGALIRASVYEPVFDAEDWDLLLGEDGRLTQSQIDHLFAAAYLLNRGSVDIPFSSAASQILASASGSKPPSGSASPIAASVAGSPKRGSSTTAKAG